MKYIDVAWVHNFPDEPVRLVSELNEERMEIRKLEIFRDGSIEYATESEASSEDIGLSYEPIPAIEEINQDPQFLGRELLAAEFESLWRAHVHV